MPDETLADAPGIRTPFPRFWLLSSAAVVLAGALAIGIRTLERPANPLDEFLPLVAAERVLAGDVPYRDYTTLYPPLMTLLDAALLSVAAPELLLARALFLAIVLAGLLAVTRIAARIARDERIAAGVGLLAAAAHGAPLWGYALVPAIVLVLWSFLATLRARAAGVERPRAWLALAGALLGLASLARHDAAAWGAIPIVAGAFLAERPRGGRTALASAATVLGTAAIFPLAFLVFLVAEGALGCAWEQLVRIPAVLYPGIRGLPWPRPWRAPGDTEGWPAIFSIYAPFLVGAMALGRTVWLARSGPRDGAAQPSLVDETVASVLPLAYLLSAAVRPDHAHAYAASLASFLGLAVLAKKGIGWKTCILLALALTLVIPSACRESLGAARVLKRSLQHGTELSRIPPRRGLLDGGGIKAPRLRAIELVKTRPPGTRIFVGLPAHDRIWLNDVGFYFDAGALPATRHHELYPLLATTEEVQREIASDLDRAQAPFVVLSAIKKPDEPNASATVFPVRVLDDYLASRYEIALDDGDYRVLARKK